MAEPAERLASLEVSYASLDRRAGEHERNDAERFERTFDFATAMKEDILLSIKNVNSLVVEVKSKVDTLWDDKNRREGAFGLGKVFAGAVGGTLAVLAEWMLRGK